MSERVCLRCDWTGDAEGASCPRCGAPLYRPGDPDRTPYGSPAEGSRDDASGQPWVRAMAAGRRRSAVIALAFVVAAGTAFGVIYLNTPDPGDVLARVEGSRSSAPTGQESPSVSDTPSPSPPASSTGPEGCSEGSTPSAVLASAVPSAAVMADYRFENALGSSVGTGPVILEVGRGTSGFADEVVLGQTRPVLRFAGGRGLSLATAGVVDREEFTIELVFRFDRLGGYRKIIDFKGASSDDGLYDLDGCLTFYPTGGAVHAAIEVDAYVQVVLTRDASAKVVGYVDGVRQFSFRDTGGRAVIGANHTLLFFRDDTTTHGEYSGGAVSRIRLYDVTLTGSEVAALACAELEDAPCG